MPSATTRARKSGAETFNWDPAARPPTDFTGDTGSGPGGLWTATPDYQWAQSPAGHALSYVSKPLSKDTAVIGAGALKAWIQAAAPSVDLQATVSEVRPDGKETFVQSGWLRASERKLDQKKSTKLEPVPSFRKSDTKPLPAGKWAKVTIPLYYEGHMYRKGSRIRVTIQAPGGDQPVWAFDQTEAHQAGQRDARPLEGHAVEAAAAGRLRRLGPDRAPALSGPARRAVPRLRAVHEPRALAALSLAIRHRRRLTAHRHPERGLLTRRAAPPASG